MSGSGSKVTSQGKASTSWKTLVTRLDSPGGGPSSSMPSPPPAGLGPIRGPEVLLRVDQADREHRDPPGTPLRRHRRTAHGWAVQALSLSNEQRTMSSKTD